MHGVAAQTQASPGAWDGILALLFEDVEAVTLGGKVGMSQLVRRKGLHAPQLAERKKHTQG